MDRNELIKEVSKYFKIQELVCPHCYSKFGESSWQFISTELLSTLYILRTKIFNKPITINTWKAGGQFSQRGLRCNMCQLVKSKNSIYLSAHCFDDQTEVLTNNGWRTYKTIQPTDLVYSMNIETENIEIKPIRDIIKYDYDGELYCAENKHISYAVTDKHRMLVKGVANKYKRITNRQISEKWNTYLQHLRSNKSEKYHIELAKDVHGRRMFFKTAGIKDNINTYDINLLRMCMAVISDGYLGRVNKQGNYELKFNLKKERDKNELEDILAKLNWKYVKKYSISHERRGCTGVYNYYVNSTVGAQVSQIIGRNKKIPMWFLSLSPDIMKQLIITYAKFDGHLDERNNNTNISIYSIDEYNIDMLQIMSILCGMRCVKKHEKNVKNVLRGKEYIVKDFYTIFITQNKDSSKVSEKSYFKRKYKGTVWCVNNDNTTLITRRNGKVVFIGNCLGKAIDFNVKDLDSNTVNNIVRQNAELFEYPIRLEANTDGWSHIDCYVPKDSSKKLLEFNG